MAVADEESQDVRVGVAGLSEKPTPPQDDDLPPAPPPMAPLEPLDNSDEENITPIVNEADVQGMKNQIAKDVLADDALKQHLMLPVSTPALGDPSTLPPQLCAGLPTNLPCGAPPPPQPTTVGGRPVATPPQLSAGLPPNLPQGGPPPPAPTTAAAPGPPGAQPVPPPSPMEFAAATAVPVDRGESYGECSESCQDNTGPEGFATDETVLIFDWDDTVLPSTWVQYQGLRLDEGSELSPWQREQLSEVAKTCAETLRIAKQFGTVVFVTNAERGWIELSCQKFMPTLYPSLENVKLVSARTTYESYENQSPLDWKLRAFESEISRSFGHKNLLEPERRKNVLSLGDSVHEREALLRSTADLPNCRSKSLKFVERPDIAQILKQHALVTSCFHRVVHHDGNLDLLIRCA